MPKDPSKLGLNKGEIALLAKARLLAKNVIAKHRGQTLNREQEVSIEKLCDIRNGLDHVIFMESGVGA